MPNAEQLVLVPVADLVPYCRNARSHSDEQVAQIAASIREFGFLNPVLMDGERGIIAGHGRIMAARKLGLEKVPCIEVSHLSDAQRRAYILADNKLALNAGWDPDLLKIELADLQAGDFDLSLTGFNVDEIGDLLNPPREELTDPDDAPPLAVGAAVSELGDVWLLGPHRVLCGSSSEERGTKFLSGCDLVLTDPPYCSGGFQESQRSSGSVGTTAAHKQIANDRLSTRGYQALMRSAVFEIDAPFFYVFTDWRMWTSLFDMAEAGGAGVRSMIVWNKGTPGMGRGWRAQHELILWAGRAAPKYDKHMAGLGNVVTLSRQRNELHTTQKPVELLETLLKGAPWVETVADPFLGSGSTLIACEKNGLACKGVELDPLYVDTIATRWQNFCGGVATLEETGETFAEVMARRRPDQQVKVTAAA
jgi:DNA modification methylase